MKIKVVFCNCNGLKLEPEDLDMNTLPDIVEQDIDIQYAVMHPKLCGRGGLVFLQDLLRGSDKETYFLVAGCAPEMQPVFLGDAVQDSGFPADRIIPVEIRGANNREARESILEAVGQLLVRKGVGSITADGFGG
jgi:heterodisulfide reductase subunit A-like polyferredoxin